jgi:uncharacterized protein
MAVDHIRYDLLVQDAMRGVVRTVLSDAAKNGLPGDHHFYISFDTRAEGVRLSQRLRAQYPAEMTIVLQHQFWDLVVTEDAFELGLSFSGVPERLGVPFGAIKRFADPSAQFAVEFEQMEADGAEASESESAPAPAAPAPRPAEPARTAEGARAPETARPESKSTAPRTTPAIAATSEPPAPPPDKPSGGGEVVRLDRFRKK